MFENIKADFKRIMEGEERRDSLRRAISGFLSQGFQALVVYRFFRWCLKRHIPTQPFRLLVERFIEITCGISIPAEVEIGNGLRIHHFGGIIFHPAVKMGQYCTLHHDVTIGDRGNPLKAPVIGNYVFIGTGARILGDITIGDNCQIGANAVVIESVPANSVVVGVPAKVIKSIEKLSQ